MQKINNGDSGLIAANKIYDNDLQALLQWKAEEYPVNTIVFNNNRFYKNNAAAIATDVPGASAKWVKLNTVDLDVEGGALSFSVAKAMLSGFMNNDTSTPINIVTVPSSATITGGHFLNNNNTYNNNPSYPDIAVVYDFPVGDATKLRVTNFYTIGAGAGFAAIAGKKKNGTTGVILPSTTVIGTGEYIYDISEYTTVSFQINSATTFPTLELLQFAANYTDVKKYIDDQLIVLDFFIRPTLTTWTEVSMPTPGETPDGITNTQWAFYPAPDAATGSIPLTAIPTGSSLIRIDGNFTLGGAGTLWLGGFNNTTNLYEQLVKGLAGTDSKVFTIDNRYEAYLYSRIVGIQKIYTGVVTQLPITKDSVKDYIDAHISSGSAISNETKAQIKRPTKLLRLEFTTPDPLPANKDQPKAKGSLVITDMEGLGLKKFATLEVQGASSATYIKKNWTFALFNDAANTDEFKLRVGNWAEHSEFVYKANWIDATHARNLISNNIWEDIVQSRTYYPKRENEIAYVPSYTGTAGRFDSGALTHVDGMPCELYINGSFYGIGCFNLGKKRENYDLKSGTQNHIQLAAETHANFYSYVPEQWEIRNPKTPDANFLTKINAWFAANALSGAAFKTNFEINHDLKNAIDFYLLAEFIQSPDMYTKNVMVTSWDGVKFYFLPYDMDTTFGLQWDGLTFTGYTTSIRSAAFWNKFYGAYTPEIKARYAELKAAGVFTFNNFYKHADKINKTFGIKSYEKEQAAWPSIPSNSVIYTGFPQLYDWMKNRIIWLDSQYA